MLTGFASMRRLPVNGVALGLPGDNSPWRCAEACAQGQDDVLSCAWHDNARLSVDVPTPHALGIHLIETGERRHGPPGPTTRVLPRRRNGRLRASLSIAECCTIARPTLGADGRFPGETGPCLPGPGPCRLCPSPTVCAGSLNTSGWRS